MTTNNTDQPKKGPFAYEPGYRSLIVREETKDLLARTRTGLKQGDIYRECRIASAAVELFLEQAANDPQTMDRLKGRVQDIVRRDLNTPRP